MSSESSIKWRVFKIIDDRDEGGSPNHYFDYIIITIIILNAFAIFLETYSGIYQKYVTFFNLFEIFTIVVFSIEYGLRIWTCTYYPDVTSPIIGRLRYATSFKMIIDFLAIFPFFLAIIFPLDTRIVNLFRLMRLFRIFKILRYFGSIDVIYSVLKKNWDALLSVFCILIVFLIFTSYSIYIFESDVQPEKFQDFDNSFWWAIVTLTTVGYGDIYPISDVGKLLTIITLLIGIMIIALPTGILISGFIEEMRLCRVRSNPVQPVFVADELRKIQALKDEGIITEGEYEILKKNLIREL